MAENEYKAYADGGKHIFERLNGIWRMNNINKNKTQRIYHCIMNKFNYRKKGKGLRKNNGNLN